MKQRLILLGAPGCGKGTQSVTLKEDMRLAHLSTGDMLREAVAAGTEIGRKAKDIMARGDLVPDEIVLAIIADRLAALAQSKSHNGFILDGFPRTVAQAEGLDRILKEQNSALDAVIYFECPDDVLRDRVCGRRIHPSSGRTYHIIFHPPKNEGLDDITGEPLVHRADDNEETFTIRYQNYLATTTPLIEYYKKQSLLYTVPADKSPEEVRQAVSQILNGQAKPSQ
eukprot:Blabericola_migrator_1__6515@NODE_3288_length_1884_cov_146_633462_g2054_i0_p2_GENE_NODE_3288_length_1884_cov_146_633462_g2054_i0NODE_3288_length_1884_cov_146_633462_g2054_i0_p2_ORF_typecomplete_len226_score44_62ADK/PF00406_22/1_5e56AAA_17/PF13207_6/2_4e25ADK_lid/PF05191_14/5e18AAA_33/PF13671_6/7_1e09AAA_18/PF13238_6/8_1e08Thymidylate_kin/PF02223_17/0_0015Hydin_ADK/PF17213_3/2Hydin_ADK/PF17213_3/1_2Zeta_toxin/PF06414_12/0_0019Cytidylate_kin/PF02224_18/0_0049tRNA_lig_kinase/PF08303_11/0_058Sox_N/P